MRAILLLAVLLASMPLAAADPAAGGGGVIVQEQQGMFRVSARFSVPQPPAAVLDVLTDYERIPHFMPDVKSSIVRQRESGRALVEQEAQARVLMFSRKVYLLLDIRESDHALTFVDTSGRSFTSYEGSWRLVPADAETQVIYELQARPAFDVPQFILVRVLRKDAAQMIERLQQEIVSRRS